MARTTHDRLYDHFGQDDQPVCLRLTNKAGVGLILGDVVIVDTTNNEAIVTTTSAASTMPVGVVQETIAANGIGLVAVSGYTSLVNVTASVTRGTFAETSTTAKKATSTASRAAGTFAIFLKGGTTPSAWLFGVPDMGSGGGGSLTVEELDGTPTVTGVTTIKVSNGTLTDDGGGTVEITTGGGSSPTFKGVLVTKSSGTNVADSTLVYLHWQTVVRDDDSWADLGTDNTKLTAPYNCAVRIRADGGWDPDSNNEREMHIEVQGTDQDYCVIPGFGGAPHTQVSEVPYLELSTGDVVKLAVRQFSGSTLTFQGLGGPPVRFLVEVFELM